MSAAAEAAPNARDPVAPDVFRAVAAAIERGDELRFDYCDRRHTSSRRRVEPHRMSHISGRWYLVGYDLDRQDWRSYRVDRLDPKTQTGPRFARRELPGPDLATFVTPRAHGSTVELHSPGDRRRPRGNRRDPHTQRNLGGGTNRSRRPARSRPGPKAPELLAAYLGAMDLDFYVDAECAPELAAAAETLAARYAAATRTPA